MKSCPVLCTTYPQFLDNRETTEEQKQQQQTTTEHQPEQQQSAEERGNIACMWCSLVGFAALLLAFAAVPAFGIGIGNLPRYRYGKYRPMACQPEL
jgi:hypothetical protein